MQEYRQINAISRDKLVKKLMKKIMFFSYNRLDFKFYNKF